MPRECYKGCDPETDETGIECDGQFVGQDCVVLEQNTYLNISVGQRLSNLITNIVLKFQSIDAGKIDKNLDTYASDALAGAGGVQIGSYYLTTDGFVKKRLL